MSQTDRMTRATFRRLCPARSHGVIRALKHPFNAHADLAEDTVTMAEYARIYYGDILTSRRHPAESLSDLHQEADLWQYTDKALLPHQRMALDRPLTPKELKQAMLSMAKGKAPGDDGLPIEFFIAMWDQVGAILLKLINNVLEGGTLTDDMCRGVITLLYKKGDKQNVRNWRPISLLNVAYKILAKVLARRLAPILPALVGTDQGAFVKGRSIAENILVAMGALEIIGRERRQVMVAMLDLEKAYDRVNWSFVLAPLEHMNFGTGFRKWVEAMYCSSTATVLVNGKRFQEFSLSRSLKQGCPLAPLLFVTQMEILLNALRTSPRIRGLKLQEDGEVRTGAIADDLLLITEATPESTQAANELLDQYEELLEAKVNWDKSAYFLPQDFDLPDDWSMKRIMDADAERYLGVQVSLTDSRPTQDAVLVSKVEASGRKSRAALGLSLMGRALVITSSMFALLWHVAMVIVISNPTIQKVESVAARFLRQDLDRERNLPHKRHLVRRRSRLGRAQLVEEKLGRLIEAIPHEWVQMLLERNQRREGMWVREGMSSEEEAPIYRLESRLEEEEWQASQWELATPPAREGNLEKKRDNIIGPESALVAIRVVPKWKATVGEDGR
ncbi:hypothetical protein CBR_g54999 [Chara braunii]|uniref:Reverse transcriptase domain-containing protein n=1 Tax=Chara braunii TaxID=69332 RepID=A0A388K7L9_CHABU|nr:hypothetical protein CBR_g54999 [Chara braunii]|eukprot:GBG66019.1 hypothetical protein CBR_g54999 [Chara braunii]